MLNPTDNLNDKQATAQFNESFVFYILYNIKAYNLHNPPISSDTPKVEFSIDNDIYNAEITNVE